MKKKILLLSLSALFLSSCGQAEFAKEAKSNKDFIEILSSADLASGTGLKIRGSYVNSASYINNSSSSIDSSFPSTHDTTIYKNDNFSYTKNGTIVSGYQKEYEGGQIDYFLLSVRGTTRTGLLTSDGSKLDEDRNNAKASLASDYTLMNNYYDEMISLAGKSASSQGLKKLVINKALAGRTAGYTLDTLEKTSSGDEIETTVYITLDRFASSWAITNASFRRTTKNSGYLRYEVYDFFFDIGEEYTDMKINLGDFRLSIDGLDSSSAGLNDSEGPLSE